MLGNCLIHLEEIFRMEEGGFQKRYIWRYLAGECATPFTGGLGNTLLVQ